MDNPRDMLEYALILLFIIDLVGGTWFGLGDPFSYPVFINIFIYILIYTLYINLVNYLTIDD